MKLATFTVGKETLVGAVDGNELVVIDVPDMRTLFELGHPVTGPAKERMTKRRFKLADVRLRAPIMPKKIFHTAGNYAEHGEEGKKANWVAEIHPWIMFFQNPDAIIGPDDPVIYPEHLTKELDYELEFCMVIGKAAKHLSVEEAASVIGGYLIFNDITARDIQRREMQSKNFVFSKSIDSFCPFGPWIVTADEIPDPYKLDLLLTVNGEKRQISNTSRLLVTLPSVVQQKKRKTEHEEQNQSLGVHTRVRLALSFAQFGREWPPDPAAQLLRLPAPARPAPERPDPSWEARDTLHETLRVSAAWPDCDPPIC